MRKGSKFADVLNAANQPEEPPADEQPAALPTQKAPSSSSPGRPKSGKRSNEAYTPVTLYLKKDTYTKVQMRMLAQGRKREVSDLVEELLAGWLENS